MSIEKTFQGAWRISVVLDNHLVTRQYFEYTRAEAIAQFKQDTKEST